MFLRVVVVLYIDPLVVAASGPYLVTACTKQKNALTPNVIITIRGFYILQHIGIVPVIKLSRISRNFASFSDRDHISLFCRKL